MGDETAAELAVQDGPQVVQGRALACSDRACSDSHFSIMTSRSGATALCIAGFRAAGYATRRDLTPIARASVWALLALIMSGIV